MPNTTTLLFDRPLSPPTDDFTTAPLSPHTLFYLTVTTPHTDEWALHGPATSFSHLLPTITSIVSDSPSAIDKLGSLRTITDDWGDSAPNREFHERGFTKFVVEGQRGTYILLEILREEGKEDVHDTLPASVFVVTAHGPLSLVPNSLGHTGMSKTSRLIGTYVHREEAKRAAEEAMEAMVGGEEGVRRTEHWAMNGGKKEKKEGKRPEVGGVLMAMGERGRWEVKVGFEEEVLRRVREGREQEGKGVGWRMKR